MEIPLRDPRVFRANRPHDVPVGLTVEAAARAFECARDRGIDPVIRMKALQQLVRRHLPSLVAARTRDDQHITRREMFEADIELKTKGNGLERHDRNKIGTLAMQT